MQEIQDKTEMNRQLEALGTDNLRWRRFRWIIIIVNLALLGIIAIFLTTHVFVDLPGANDADNAQCLMRVYFALSMGIIIGLIIARVITSWKYEKKIQRVLQMDENQRFEES